MWSQRLIEPTPRRRAQLRGLAEARIGHRAYYDALTGLPNQNLFDRRVAAAISQAQMNRGGFAVLALDVDGFREINETLGHASGDDVLRRLASRLTRSIRISDTVCRAEAGRFLVLLDDMPSAQLACRAASRILVALSRSILVPGGSLVVSVSVGISLFPEHGQTETLLTARAAEALSEAKHEGRASIRVFSETEDLAASA